MDAEQRFKTLAVAAIIDGKFDPAERKVLAECGKRLGLPAPISRGSSMRGSTC